jgi:hypothetical protein
VKNHLIIEAISFQNYPCQFLNTLIMANRFELKNVPRYAEFFCNFLENCVEVHYARVMTKWIVLISFLCLDILKMRLSLPESFLRKYFALVFYQLIPREEEKI